MSHANLPLSLFPKGHDTAGTVEGVVECRSIECGGAPAFLREIDRKSLIQFIKRRQFN